MSELGAAVCSTDRVHEETLSAWGHDVVVASNVA
jgi:hypothetical protein